MTKSPKVTIMRDQQVKLWCRDLGHFTVRRSVKLTDEFGAVRSGTVRAGRQTFSVVQMPTGEWEKVERD